MPPDRIYLVEGDYTGSWQYVPKDLWDLARKLLEFRVRRHALTVTMRGRMPVRDA